MMISDVTKLLSTLIEKDTEESEAVQNEIRITEQTLENINALLTKAVNYSKSEAELEAAIKLQTEKTPLIDELKERAATIKSKTPEIENKQKQVTEIEAQYGEYDLLREKKNTVITVNSSLCKDKETVNSIKEKILFISQKITAMKEELSGLADSGTKKEKLLNTKEQTENKIQKADELKKQLTAFEN